MQLLALALLASSAHHDPTSEPSADWTRFRGPAGTSVLAERRFPAEWGPEQNVAWSVEVDGSGWSSPIVVGGRVFLTAAVDPAGEGPKGMAGGVSDPSTRGRGAKPEGELAFELTCRSLSDGSLLWKREVGKRVPEYPVHRSNTFATETPTTDGQRVFVTFGALGVLACYDLDGEEEWRVDTGVHRTGNDFGWGISLVTHGGLVFLQNDNEESSFLAAFDAATGEERWRAQRRSGTSWGTPVVWETEGRASLVACGPDTVIAYDPATGEEHWRVQGFGGSFSSSPTHDGERLYFGNSGPMSRGPLLAVPAEAEGTFDLTAVEPRDLAWRADRSGPGFASPVVHDGLVWILGSGSILACHDAATGERLYKERLPDLAQVVATPWVAGGELHVMDEEGTTVVLRAGPDFEVLRTNRIAGLYWGTPSVAGDALLLREARRLHCIRE
jgi:outer membrane protein assembly factor BamB